MHDAGYTILVVDDEEVIRYTLQKKLSRLGYHIIALEKAEDALYIIKRGEKVDLIITDIKLRKMDGIELLQRIHGRDEPIPVLIITGHGNVEDAISALRYGACDFIRKPFDINEVASSVRSVLRNREEKKKALTFAKYLSSEHRVYDIPNDPDLVNPISYTLTRDLVSAGICNATTAENITLSLREAISNAMYHGNLEIGSELRDSGGMKQFNEEIERRRDEEPFCHRTVKIEYTLTSEYVEYRITDQGGGFDFHDLPDPRDPDNFLKNSGRGLLIIRVHMDEVTWNEQGNMITLRKNRIETTKEKKKKEDDNGTADEGVLHDKMAR